eukprot:gene5130-biopygen11646
MSSSPSRSSQPLARRQQHTLLGGKAHDARTITSVCGVLHPSVSLLRPERRAPPPAAPPAAASAPSAAAPPAAAPPAAASAAPTAAPGFAPSASIRATWAKRLGGAEGADPAQIQRCALGAPGLWGATHWNVSPQETLMFQRLFTFQWLGRARPQSPRSAGPRPFVAQRCAPASGVRKDPQMGNKSTVYCAHPCVPSMRPFASERGYTTPYCSGLRRRAAAAAAVGGGGGRRRRRRVAAAGGGRHGCRSSCRVQKNSTFRQPDSSTDPTVRQWISTARQIRQIRQPDSIAFFFLQCGPCAHAVKTAQPGFTQVVPQMFLRVGVFCGPPNPDANWPEGEATRAAFRARITRCFGVTHLFMGFVICVVHPPMSPGDCVGACPFLSSGHKMLAHEYQRSYDVRKIFDCIRFVSAQAPSLVAADQWGKLMPWEYVDCPCMLVSRTVRSGSCLCCCAPLAHERTNHPVSLHESQVV